MSNQEEVVRNLNEREYMFERVEEPNYERFRKWNTLTKKIMNIKDL